MIFLLYIISSWAIIPLVRELFNKNSKIFYFIGLNLTFIPLLLSIFLIYFIYHKFKPKKLITTQNKVLFYRIFTGFFLWFLIQLIIMIFTLVFFKESLKFNFNFNNFLIFLLLTLILTPIQTSTEEILFRGYIQEFVSTIIKIKFLPVVISAILFALPHLANPEVTDKTIFFFTYFAMGILLSYLTQKYKGLEYSLGIHFANNFFTIVFVNYPDTPLPSSPLFLLIKPVNPLQTLIETALCCLIVVIIIKIIEKKCYQFSKN